ncbi:glycosyltransferase family 4 protein [uncultured Draconibacterium sp.]|uniref:glycosyltransferase family 4 protein n=1 Tax=uncultured Draconibacterium sp. TaxID=1573823 RepID=UPI002AA699CC|nr:glycosyltransferase family 4 protein [uncultured Draconibacterium sp.]
MNKKVLIITYYWPPAGGPGVQRVLKFAKYLPEFGWDPIILTVSDGEYPAIDESLAKDIPNNCKVYKTKALEPNFFYRKFTGMKAGEKIPVANLAQKNVSWKKKLANWVRLNLFIPDAKIGWIPYAVSEGKRIIKKENPDIIFSSSPPPTVHLIAKKLAKWSKIKWVADFRDPWTKIHYLQNQKVNPVSKRRNERLERNVVNECNKASCVSANFINLITENRKDKFEIITNGYDIETDGIAKPTKPNEKFTILYIGGLTWNRYYKSFFIWLIELINNGDLDRNKVRIKLAGSIEPTIKREIEEMFSELNILDLEGYLPHSEAISLMQKADLLLLFLEQVEGYEGHIPGKLFEYLSTYNRILGLGNTGGESSQILENSNAGKIFEPRNEQEIKKYIISEFCNWQNGKKSEINSSNIDKFSRRQLTEQLATLFEKL